MKKTLFRALSPALSALLCLALFAFPARAAAKPAVYAGGYILMEAGDRVPLLEENADRRLPPASTTKIMTCLVALERCDPHEEVSVAPEACGAEGSSAYLRPGERLTVKELLLCLMLGSANDAAEALALHIAGGNGAFALLMNEKAAALGLQNTRFANPHGLPEDGHFSSARDLALLACAALENDAFREIVGAKRAAVGSGSETRRLTNHNRLLFSLDGCIGVKTGYTLEAGRCLVSACERNGTRLVCVTLSCRDDWEAHAALYGYGFASVRRVTLEEREFFIPAACSDAPVAVRHGAYSFLISPGDLVTYAEHCPAYLIEPVRAGDTVGEVSVYLNGTEIARLPVTALEDRDPPAKDHFIKRIVRWIASLFRRRKGT